MAAVQPPAYALVALVAAAVPSASPGQPPGPQPRFGAGVQLVEVYASVTDRAGVPLRGLRQDQFSVLEDGVPQRIAVFVEGDFPLSIAVAIDRSWSMAGERLARAKAGARTLVDELRPDDQVMIVAISSDVETVSPLSTDRASASDAIDGLDPWSTTALHDALVSSLDSVQRGTGRRALVLLSDGADRYSQASAADVLSHARDLDVLVYPIALGSRRPPLFSELAAATGGRSFVASDQKALESAVREVARDLRYQYLLGYAPTRPPGEARGQWRSIRVTVDDASAEVLARDGYRGD
jgi:Ca-activated chloride channel family protein